MAKGIKSLHSIGYVHRDIKPDNILIDLQPLTVRIADFNLSLTNQQSTTQLNYGTPGYYPVGEHLRDGSQAWDIWALGAVILESDMETDSYARVMTERGSISKAEKVFEEKGVCKHLKAIVRGTIFRVNA